MTKKILAALLAVMMIVSLLPATFAVNAGCPGYGHDHNLLLCPDAEKVGDPIAPGCCTPGYQLYECKDCHDHFAGDIVECTPEADCTWKLVTDYVAPTCTEAGAWAKYVCEKNENTVKYTDADGNDVTGTAAPVALGHTYNENANCHDRPTCLVCGVQNEVGKHSWEKAFNHDDIDFDSIKDPTEQQNGQFRYKCADCGEYSGWYVIYADDHNLTEVEEEPATCAKPGMMAHYTCSNACCEGKFFLLDTNGNPIEVTRERLIINSLPHTYKEANDPDYDAWVTQIDPTCKTNGYTYKRCTVCDKWIEATEEMKPASDLYHSWTILEPAVVGTCTQKGKTEVKACSVCRIVVGGEEIEGTGEGHAEVTVTFDGDCSHEAYSFTYCTNAFCENTLVTSLTLGATTVDLTEIAADGVKVLEYEVGEKKADVHNNIGWLVTQTPSCIAGGHKVEICLDCEDYATGRSEAIAASEDYCNFGDAPLTPATCTEQAIYKCSYCRREEKRGAPNGHDYTNQPILTVDAHCKDDSGAGEDGYKYQECKNCLEKKILETVPYELDYIYEDEDLARSQHSLPAGFKAIYVQGDCDVQGLWTLGNCADCGRTVLLIDAETGNGHVELAGSRVNPTCTSAGGYTCQNSFCSVENKWIAEAALGHTLEKVEAKDADCVNDGNIEHYKCTRTDCGAILVAATDCTIADDKLSVSLPSLNLLPEMWVIKAPAVDVTNDDATGTMTLTVTEDIADGTYTLVTSTTEYTFIIADGKFVAALVEFTGTVKIEAYEHGTSFGSVGFGSNVNSYNANDCTQIAYENLKWCSRCGYSEMYGYTAAAEDHTWNEEDKKFVDCEENYYLECQVDGCDHTKEILDSAPGHKNSDDRYFFSGCEDTEENRHCVVCCEDPENCEGIEDECLIPNTHNFYVVIFNAPPTCKEYGYDLLVCEDCGYEQINIVADKLAHNMVWDDYTEDGKIRGECTMCGLVEYKTGISFELAVDNFNAPGAGYTQSSLIEVTVNLCASIPNTALRGFNFCVKTTGVMFVGFEYVSEDFDIGTVTSPENAKNATNGVITVNGMASNDRFTDEQNVAVSGKNAVVKLYFRVLNVDAVSFSIPATKDGYTATESAWVYTYDEETDSIQKNDELYGDQASAYVKDYLDITCDGATTMTDVLEAYEMISNPEENETPYNVVMDIDKDGTVTVQELKEIMNFLSGNYTLEEMLQWNVDEDHMALIGTFLGA